MNHKFKNHDFGNGFETKNAILRTNYEPQIMILGTFNPLTNEVDNMADFFYGRNWFWPSMFNIFEHQKIQHKKQRKYTSPPNYDPTLQDIKLFCEKHKLTFADLISSVLNQNNVEYKLENNKAIVGDKKYDLISDGDLGKLDNLKQVEWTTNDLIKFITDSKSITTIYFTRQLGGPFTAQWLALTSHDYGRPVSFKKIFTPSGQGLKGKPRADHLIHHWLFNTNPSYNQIDNNWLTEHNINKGIFANP